MDRVHHLLRQALLQIGTFYLFFLVPVPEQIGVSITAPILTFHNNIITIGARLFFHLFIFASLLVATASFTLPQTSIVIRITSNVSSLKLLVFSASDSIDF